MPSGRPAKRRRLTPPQDDSAVSETIKASDLLNRAADWDLEQAYEQRSRQKRAKEPTKLPIKTREGNLQAVKEQKPGPEDSDSFLGSGSEDGEAEDPETPPTDVEVKPTVPLKQQIIATKEEIARIAGLLNEDPEEHAGNFKKLGQLGVGAPLVIQKLVLVAQAAVYKDAIPGYRIRSYKEDELNTKVSKDVRQTRQYEQALVTGYQGYVKRLSTLSKRKQEASTSEDSSIRSLAISCVCTLLLSVPHFNYRTELLNILVHELASRQATPEFLRCVDTLEQFFMNDDDGAPSLEAVTILSKMIKVKDYRIREEVLNTFFKLRLLSELLPKGADESRDPRHEMSKFRGKKSKKGQWEHRSKKEKKVARERKEVEKDMKEAEESVNYEEREKMQSETLKLVFVTYLRILKERVPSLMGAVLEGLARYAHLINQDFFGDILEALKDIISQAEAEQDEEENELEPDQAQEDPRDQASQRQRTRECLLSTQTAFTLLSGQDVSKSASALHLDLSFFTNHTYRSLYTHALDADIELGPKSIHLADPHSSTNNSNNNNPDPSAIQRRKINVSTPILLLIRVATSILLTPSQPPPTLIAATFYKRLLTMALQLPEKSSIAVLNLLTKLVDKHGRKVEALWYSDERKGDGVFHGDSDRIEGTNVLAVGSGVWETELLKSHYCPRIREQVKEMEKVVKGLAK